VPKNLYKLEEGDALGPFLDTILSSSSPYCFKSLSLRHNYTSKKNAILLSQSISTPSAPSALKALDGGANMSAFAGSGRMYAIVSILGSQVYSNLEMLSLRGCHMGMLDGLQLGATLKSGSLPSLKDLNLSYYGIADPQGLFPVLRAIAQGSSRQLHKLNLS